MEKSFVVITDAPAMDYQTDYVSLPKDYATPAYYEKPEVKSIIETVHKNLSQLDAKVHFSDKIKGKKVLIKPNLVMVYYNLGYKDKQYPETTDPRVFDAVVSFIKKYTDNIVIVESSGRGMPTRASFKIAGYDRIAEHHKTGLVALEEQPVDRYMLPKAEVMKEIYIPRIFSEVVSGEAFYISVPKMKTNLYTKVTLGFKNAMGTIPYNLRQRNHNHAINKKLVDMLFLFKPDLVIIDGIIGGEGNTPAPVDPVNSHVIVSGNNCVETDWIATEMMGFDPEEVELMTQARKMGFGNSNLEVIGNKKITPYRKADQSLISARMLNLYPNVKVFLGHTKTTAPQIVTLENVTPETIVAMEKACIGGCVASLRTAFEDIYYQGKNTDFVAKIVIGAGVPVNGETYYFDSSGKAYTPQDIKQAEGKLLNFGTCTKEHFQALGDLSAYGCMPKPALGLTAVHKLSGKQSKVFTIKNKQFVRLIRYMLKTRKVRIDLIKAGEWVDCTPTYFQDKIYEIPQLSQEDMTRDYVPWPLPKIEGTLKKELLAEARSIL